MSRVIMHHLNQDEKKVVFSVKKNENVVYVLVGTESGTKEIVFELKGEGAKLQILGLFIGCKENFKIRTIQHHLAPNTASDLLFKSVLFGAARFDFKGLIRIEKGAQAANAYQRNDNLLMSPDAKVDTQPELEILADEVRCTHAATVGKQDEKQLFYLMSRGLSRKQAVQIMLEGFFAEVLDQIPNKSSTFCQSNIAKPKSKQRLTEDAQKVLDKDVKDELRELIQVNS